MLDSENTKAWESVSLLLVGSGRGAFYNSPYYAELLCSFLNLSHLAIGTSYLTAYDLLEDLERAKKILNVSDKVSGRLSLALKAEANRWLKEYVIDSVESFGNGRDWESEYQPSKFDCYIEDWETFVKKKIHDVMLRHLNPYSLLCGFCDDLGEFLTEDISLDQVEKVVEDCVSEYVWDLNLEYKDDGEDCNVDTADDYRYEMAQYQNDMRAVEKLFIESC